MNDACRSLEPMRIALVTHSISTWAAQFVQFFKEQGDTVLLISFSPQQLPGVEMEFVGVEPFDRLKNKHLFFTRVPRIRHILRRFQPDIVYAIYLSSNGLSAALAWGGCKAVSAVGSDVLEHSGRVGLRRRLREAVIRFVCRRNDVINTVSADLEAELIRLGVPASKMLRLPFGVDLQVFHPDPGQQRRRAHRIICTRRHEPIYDIPTVLHGLQHLKKTHRFHCIFTSGGCLLEAHMRLAVELGLGDETTFTGSLPHGELPGRLREAQVYVSASLGDGTSVSLLEAMASGLLPVASAIPANKPWINHGINGLLFRPSSAEELARCLARAMDDKALRERAFTENRERVCQEADAHANMKKLRARFERIVTARRGS